MRARTYNQSHVPRPHSGGRRISIYWTWSYPWESCLLYTSPSPRDS